MSFKTNTFTAAGEAKCCPSERPVAVFWTKIKLEPMVVLFIHNGVVWSSIVWYAVVLCGLGPMVVLFIQPAHFNYHPPLVLR